MNEVRRLTNEGRWSFGEGFLKDTRERTKSFTYIYNDMRYLMTILLISLSFSASCQTIDFYAGPNFNLAHKAFSGRPVDTLRIYPGISLAVQKGFIFKNRTMECAAGYSYYKGQYSNGYTGWSNSHHAYGYYQNHAISLEFYPLVLGKNKFTFSAGIVASYRFLSNNRLHVSNWHDNTSGSLTGLYDVDELGNEWGSHFIGGLNLNLSRSFVFGTSTSIICRLQIYQGLTGDYQVYGNRIRRTSLTPQIGVRKTF